MTFDTQNCGVLDFDVHVIMFQHGQNKKLRNKKKTSAVQNLIVASFK